MGNGWATSSFPTVRQGPLWYSNDIPIKGIWRYPTCWSNPMTHNLTKGWPGGDRVVTGGTWAVARCQAKVWDGANAAELRADSMKRGLPESCDRQEVLQMCLDGYSAKKPMVYLSMTVWWPMEKCTVLSCLFRIVSVYVVFKWTLLPFQWFQWVMLGQGRLIWRQLASEMLCLVLLIWLEVVSLQTNRSRLNMDWWFIFEDGLMIHIWRWTAHVYKP